MNSYFKVMGESGKKSKRLRKKKSSNEMNGHAEKKPSHDGINRVVFIVFLAFGFMGISYEMLNFLFFLLNQEAIKLFVVSEL